jgi:FdhD protein
VSDPKPSLGPLAAVAARRLPTDAGSAPAEDEIVQVVREAALFIDVEGVGSYTLLCTPTDLRALTVGFLLTEGVIAGLDEIAVLAECLDDPTSVTVRLTGPRSRVVEPGQDRLIVSSCGLCGAEDVASRIAALPGVGKTLQVEATSLRRSVQALRRRQPLFAACGATHAAGLFDASGDLLAVIEDVGRHNALDKVIGRCLLDGCSPAGYGVMLSGRVSLEMVSKCARAGIEFMGAVSAPTSLAVEAADNCGITLCAFIRGTRATVFTHPERLRLSPEAGSSE